jgi:hypothetical protein
MWVDRNSAHVRGIEEMHTNLFAFGDPIGWLRYLEEIAKHERIRAEMVLAAESSPQTSTDLTESCAVARFEKRLTMSSCFSCPQKKGLNS